MTYEQPLPPRDVSARDERADETGCSRPLQHAGDRPPEPGRDDARRATSPECQPSACSAAADRVSPGARLRTIERPAPREHERAGEHGRCQEGRRRAAIGGEIESEGVRPASPGNTDRVVARDAHPAVGKAPEESDRGASVIMRKPSPVARSDSRPNNAADIGGRQARPPATAAGR